MNITIKNLMNKNDVKEMIENGIILTDEEVKAIVKEHNKTAGFFGKKSERGIVKAYRGTLKIVERENKLAEKKSYQKCFKEIYNEIKSEQEEKDRIKAIEKQRKAELKAMEKQRKAELKAMEKQRKKEEKQRKAELKAMEKQRKKEEKQKAEQMKQINEFCELAGITLEEYEELSTFERAQLNLQRKQMVDMNQTKKMVAVNTIANGFDRL